MKILWCSWKDLAHPMAGGAEVYTHAVSSRLASSGHEVWLATGHAVGAPAREDVDGVHVVRRGGPLVGCHRAVRHFYERSWSTWDLVVDEVNTRPFNAPIWSRGTPVMALCHQLAGEVWWHEAPAPLALVGRHVLETAWWRRYRDTTTATVSRSTADSLREIRVTDVRLVGEGRTVRHVAPTPKASAPTVLALGRISASKRPFDILDAHRILRRSRPDARLVFVGDGPDLPRLERAAAEVDGVDVLGRVDDDVRDRQLGSAWALAVASVREGWCLAVSEAAEAGTFTVGYRVPGVVDSVSATGGVLCDPTPEAMAAALHTNLDRFAATRPSSTGCDDWDVIGERFEQLAIEVAGTSPRGPGPVGPRSPTSEP